MFTAEVREKCPIMNVDGVLGGLWADREGYVDTTDTVWAMPTARRPVGRGRAQVEELISANDAGTW